MKPLQRYFHIELFIQYAVVTSESVDEMLWCNHLKDASLGEDLHGTICLRILQLR